MVRVILSAGTQGRRGIFIQLPQRVAIHQRSKRGGRGAASRSRCRSLPASGAATRAPLRRCDSMQAKNSSRLARVLRTPPCGGSHVSSTCARSMIRLAVELPRVKGGKGPARSNPPRGASPRTWHSHPEALRSVHGKRTAQHRERAAQRPVDLRRPTAIRHHPRPEQSAHPPVVDRLCAEGVAFSRAYCQSPVCLPSRASFLTGLYPNTIHVNRNGNAHFPANERVRLTTRREADRGYDCGLAAKLHIASCWCKIRCKKATDPFLKEPAVRK